MEKPKLYFLVGPTASGKTALSVELALRMDAEIVSADSIQIYRGMDIGSAKPTQTEKKGIPHHMIDVADPLERGYSVTRYRDEALRCIHAVAARGKKTFVVGGTGLYVNALVYPLEFTAAPPNAVLRSYWNEREGEAKGSAHGRLRALDPKAANRLHPNDVKRVIRALEIIEATGKTLAELGADFTRRDDESLPFIPVMASLTMPRDTLYRRIETRVDEMLAAGFVDEVHGLLERGVDPASPAMQGLGYKQIAKYLGGECALEEAIENIRRETRRFAKRQLTWFRREERIRWFDVAQCGDIGALLDATYDYFMEA
ncbi:MAG TPA: tRNA (adenosine(37)-N6)-dimethylallyltransferase MiaA [Clostridia bacterium]|nr:tRNA (adenosine(37)-N6)-dimethylallyltransferase MiaA [Clostridia bacterium]